MIDGVDVDVVGPGDPKTPKRLRIVIETDDGRVLGESEWRDVSELPKQ